VQIYLLCYCFLRFQQLNDQLLEAFKKRALTYYAHAKRDATLNAASYMAQLHQIRKNVSNMLLAIKRSSHKTHVPKATLFHYMPESELETTAKLLLNEDLDPECLFWKEIDKQSGSIQLNLRSLFLTLDIHIVHHDYLKMAVKFLKATLLSQPNNQMVGVPQIIIQGLPVQASTYLVENGQCHLKRLEFWLYYQLAQQVKSNTLTLQYTTKYKRIQDDLVPESIWRKDKSTILKTLPYSKLKVTPKNLIADVKQDNRRLFQEVNAVITSGHDPNIIVTTVDGKPQWRLKPLQEENAPNPSIFEKVPKRSIVDIMQFVDKHLHFTDYRCI
jgi:hypothetical protein